MHHFGFALRSSILHSEDESHDSLSILSEHFPLHSVCALVEHGLVTAPLLLYHIIDWCCYINLACIYTGEVGALLAFSGLGSGSLNRDSKTPDGPKGVRLQGESREACRVKCIKGNRPDTISI